MAADDAALYREYQQLDRQYVDAFEELRAIFEEFGVEDLNGLRQLAQDLPSDASEAWRLFDDLERLDTEQIDEYYGYDYIGQIGNLEPTPEMERLRAKLEEILKKYGTEEVDYLDYLKGEISSELRNAEDLSKTIDELVAAKQDVQDQIEWAG